MKSINIFTMMILSGVIFHSVYGYSLSLNPNPDIFPHVPHVPGIDFPDIPRIPNIPKMPELEPPFEIPEVVLQKDIEYSVTFQSRNAKPPSCDVIKQRLKAFQTRFSELTFYTDKIAKGDFLTSTEIQSLATISRKYLPDILDDVDKDIVVNIESNYLTSSSLGFKTIYIGNSIPSDFDKFKFTGPGVVWEGDFSQQPPFVTVITNPSVIIRFKTTMLDFCFTDSVARFSGSKDKGSSFEVTSFTTTWKPDVYSQHQSYVTEVIHDNILK